ncbi:MAG: hypothetical protein RMJ88_16595, partial [Thermogemmata sp.]|nr:hypothetical protein [Thermogemmata sp.]
AIDSAVSSGRGSLGLLSKERCLVLELQVHGVLDGRQFVMIEALGTGDGGPYVHHTWCCQ